MSTNANAKGSASPELDDRILDQRLRSCSIGPILIVPVHDQAIPIFIRDYVLCDARMPGSFHFLPDMLKNESTESGLMHAIKALGIARIAMKARSPNALVEGDVEYAEALHAVNLALADPERAREDRTLITVMMLGMYEVSFNVCCREAQAERACRVALVAGLARYSHGLST